MNFTPLQDAPALWLAVALLVPALLSTLGTRMYTRAAKRWNILAIPNERSLHAEPVPKGGGVIVGATFLLAVLVLWLAGSASAAVAAALIVGGGALVAVGFLDDLREVSPVARFALHFAVATWALFWLGGVPTLAMGPWSLEPSAALNLFGILGIVWFINLFNFMDGIDGMLASGSLVSSLGAAVILIWRGEYELACLLLALGGSCSGFLRDNWSPARIFMGDSGGAFLGYTMSVLLLHSVGGGQIAIWTWVILLGYFIGDTTVTLFLRIATVRGWWHTHRSHAYQHLAFVWKDHRRVTLIVLGISILWMLPLAILSERFSSAAPLIAALALTPVCFGAIRWGPLFRPSVDGDA